MHLLCPHCRNPIELVEIQAGQDIACPSCGSTFRLEGGSTTAYQPPKGQKLGKFELLETLGQGAFGTVYKARDPELDRTVAIKVPRTGNLGDGQDLDRFLREARSVAQLRHPSIVAVHEVGEFDTSPLGGGGSGVRGQSLPYLVSDFVEGITLADLISSKRLGFRESAELIGHVADALHFAHESGVVHRDVKPSNIMLEKNQTQSTQMNADKNLRQSTESAFHCFLPRLMDFGLAKRDAGEITMTMDGQVLGTPAYMSPEQARGEAHQVDGRSDVYSLGVILYQLLTGELPFRGTTRMLMHQVLNEEPRPPRKLNDRIPRDLETICLKALAKEPGRRYHTAGAFADDLRRFLKGEAILARPVGRLEKAWRWGRRNPVVAGLAAAVVVLLVTGTVVSSYFAFAATLAKGQADTKAREAEANADLARGQKTRADHKAMEAEANEKEARRRLYIADMRLAQRAWEENQLGRLLEILSDHHPLKTKGIDLRGFEWFYQQRLCNSELLTLRDHEGRVHQVVLAPDGKRLATASADRTVRVWDADTGENVATLQGHRDEVNALAFSPDGEKLTSASWDRTVRIWNAKTGQQQLRLTGHASRVFAVAWAPDGKWIASAGEDHVIKLWDAVDGRLLHTLKGHAGPVFCLSFDPGSNQLASGDSDGLINVWDVLTGQQLHSFRGHTLPVRGIAFHPGGNRLVSVSDDGTLRIWDRSGVREPIRIDRRRGPIFSVALSPDGSLLVSGNADGAISVLDARTGREIHSLKGHTLRVNSVVFSHDGKKLVSAGDDQTAKVWSASTSHEPIFLEGHAVSVRSVAFSPDGRKLASGAGNPYEGRGLAEVTLWDAQTGHKLQTFQGHTAAVRCVRFAPTGKSLASAAHDGTVRIWDLADPDQAPITLSGHTGFVLGVDFSPDGEYVASAGQDRTVRIWASARGHEKFVLRGHTTDVTSVVFSPDGKRLASASRDAVILWDPARGEKVRSVERPGEVIYGLAFSPDGELLAMASHDGAVRLCDISHPEDVRVLKGHSGPAFSVSFSPDGKRVASASHDATVRVWDVASGQETLTLKSRGHAETSVAFSPDGNRLVSAGDDRTLKIWDARPLAGDVLVDREALDSYRHLTRSVALKEEMINRIRLDASLSEPVRKRALVLVERHREEPRQLVRASGALTRKRGANSATYQLALRQAEAARRLLPEKCAGLHVQAAAQFRLGRYQDAIRTLTEAEMIHAKNGVDPLADDLALLAMCQHQLGQHQQAQATLVRLRELIKKTEATKDADTEAFFREAEELIEGKAIGSGN